MIASLAAFPIHAQEALRSSIAGEQAAFVRKRVLENQPYNVKLGPVNVLFRGSLGVELNDNVNLSDDNRQEDLVLHPEAGIYAVWPVTVKNSLNLAVNVGYDKYVEHSEYDRLVIRPGSELSFDLFIKDFKINIHDRFDYTEDPIGQGSLSGEAQFGGFSNTAGVDVNWDLNEVMLTLGYDHYTFLSSVVRYEYLDRDSDSVVARLSVQSHPAVRWGLEAAGGFSDYDLNFLNDNWNYSAGVFAEWTVTDKLRLRPRAGYLQYLFEPGGSVGNTPDNNAWYFALNAAHVANSRMSQTIDAGRTVQLGINADLLDLWYVRHQAAWRIIRNVGMQTFLFYEHGDESGPLFSETYERYGGGISFTYQLMEKLETRLGYNLTLKESDVPLRDYYQNRLTLVLAYRF